MCGSVRDLDSIMAWLSRDNPARVSLMSTWALSEMPMAVRDRIEPFFGLGATKKALLAYQPSFEGNDNEERFSLGGAAQRIFRGDP